VAVIKLGIPKKERKKIPRKKGKKSENEQFLEFYVIYRMITTRL